MGERGWGVRLTDWRDFCLPSQTSPPEPLAQEAAQSAFKEGEQDGVWVLFGRDPHLHEGSVDCQVDAGGDDGFAGAVGWGSEIGGTVGGEMAQIKGAAIDALVLLDAHPGLSLRQKHKIRPMGHAVAGFLGGG